MCFHSSSKIGDICPEIEEEPRVLGLSVGSGFLELSPLQISSLAVISGRLWVGTGGGALFSIPLSISKLHLVRRVGGFAPV